MSTSSNYVILYKDFADSNSASYRIDVEKFAESAVHSLSGTFQDCTSFVRYNLPKGCVVTLLDNVTTAKIPDLAGAGRVYDLIGDGEEHVVDLRLCNMNDCVSAFVWRTVDVSQGYVFLFEGADFTGARTTIFPSEWEFYKDHSLVGWFINDRLSSIKWEGMMDTVNLVLYEHIGTGVSYDNIGGRAEEIPNLKTVGFNDTASSFRWTRVTPVKEVIQDVVITNIVPQNQSGTTLESEGSVNAGDNPATMLFAYTNSIAESTSVTVSTTHSTGGAVDYSYTWRKDADSNECTLRLSLSYDYERTDSNTTSKTEYQEISTAKTLTCPPQSRYEYQWIAETGRADVQFTTTATRWYKQEFAGTEWDNGLYKRNETVSGRFNGMMYVTEYYTFNTYSLTDPVDILPEG